jgi:hypothetical protein
MLVALLPSPAWAQTCPNVSISVADLIGPYPPANVTAGVGENLSSSSTGPPRRTRADAAGQLDDQRPGGVISPSLIDGDEDQQTSVSQVVFVPPQLRGLVGQAPPFSVGSVRL